MSWRTGFGFVALFACVAAFVWRANLPREALPPGPPPVAVDMPARAELRTKPAPPAAPAVPALEVDLSPATPRGPFRYSVSVARACQRSLALGECLKIDDFLDKLRVEPRDERWAGRAEALFEKSIREEGRGAFNIRALECRRTRCAVEYESETGDMDYWPPLDELRLFRRYTTFAHEHDPRTGILTRVSVDAWQTTASIEAEEAADAASE